MFLNLEDPYVVQEGTSERRIRKEKVGYKGWRRGAMFDYLRKMVASWSRRQGTVRLYTYGGSALIP
jgi:hypothetical protein